MSKISIGYFDSFNKIEANDALKFNNRSSSPPSELPSQNNLDFELKEKKNKRSVLKTQVENKGRNLSYSAKKHQ